VPGLVGRAAAAPILFDAFARSGKTISPLPHAPRAALIAANAKLPLPLQRFRSIGLPSEGSEPALKFMFPPNGARLELAADAGAIDPVAVKVSGGTLPLTVLANGVPLENATAKRTLFYQPEGPGFVRLTVVDAKGLTDSIVVRLQ
ncbi:MAG: penicillin-binding protein 1C, partial [Xanthobacteraceae bacterium]|nr:penicillin-binding protein 1C [Xanthobacteraceae bacterium]